jgi:hypothetical protein
LITTASLDCAEARLVTPAVNFRTQGAPSPCVAGRPILGGSACTAYVEFDLRGTTAAHTRTYAVSVLSSVGNTFVTQTRFTTYSTANALVQSRDLGNGVFGRPVLVNVDSSGQIIDGVWPSVSATGRFVAFASSAGNAVPPADSRRGSLFIRDTTSARTKTVPISRPDGFHGDSEPSLSADGSRLAFTGFATAPRVDGDQVFVRDLGTNRVVLSSAEPGNSPPRPASFGNSFEPALSADGSVVAFSSESDLVGTSCECQRIFARDVARDFTTGRSAIVLASVDSTGSLSGNPSNSPAISSDGGVISFSTSASLVASDTGQQQDIYSHIAPSSVAFPGNVDLGMALAGATGTPVGVRFTNNGSAPVTLTNARVVGPFRVVSDPCSGITLHPDGSCTVTVALQTGTVSRPSGSLTLTVGTGFFLRPDATVGLTGTVQSATFEGITRLASVGSVGSTLSSTSHFPAISADGRYVSFLSYGRAASGGPLQNAAVFQRDQASATTVQ